MGTASIPYRVHHCSNCPGDTKYYCVSCPCELCLKCKDNHVKDLQTLDHDVVSYRDNISYISTREICPRHPSNRYIKYCEPCNFPICLHCAEHSKHKTLGLRTAYKKKRKQNRGTIHTISRALFYRPDLLQGIKSNIKTCRSAVSLYQSEMLTKAQTLKGILDYIQSDFTYNVLCDFDFKHRCLRQKIEMSTHIVSLQRYEHKYEHSAFRVLQFLSSIKTTLLKIQLTLHTNQLSMAESFNEEDVTESLSAITERRIHVENKCLLTLMPAPEFHQSLILTGVDRCNHISCVTSHLVWVSDGYNLILKNKTGVTIYRVENVCRGLCYGNGLQTVNSEGELIYIAMNFNIQKLSKDMKTTTKFIRKTDSTWRPQCVYWSPSTGDLLVGMYYNWEETGKVTRYNQSGKLTQTIQHNNTERGLYRQPIYITENNNGDVVVSDLYRGLVVTERGGRHRFSNNKLRPVGICTDALSHILVCDITTKTVQMFDGDGQFLSYLLTKSQEMCEPYSLSYDVNTHRLWVGSWWDNKVFVYRYITNQDALTEQRHMFKSPRRILTTGAEKPQQGNKCLLKLISPPRLLHSFTVTGVDDCYHISCVTSDLVWVSDDKHNIILTNTKGVTLHCVENSYRYLKYYYGIHTVNSDSELIYMDRNEDINKQSKDMKTTKTYTEKRDSIWGANCVYWSPSTEDLLVGVYRIEPWISKISRYNQSGQLTKNIQLDNKGRRLYKQPIYLTENNNGDVVVSDWYKGVVVTDRGGRHRFSYIGPPSGSRLKPRGICTDALSHILVCDVTTKTVQMLDGDGKFLSHILNKSQETGEPYSLSYDVNTHRLWVGSRRNKKVCVYNYITDQDALTFNHMPRTDGDALSSSTSAVEWR